MGRRWKHRPDSVSGRHFAAFRYDRHDAGSEAWSLRSALQSILQARLEAVDEDAGRTQAGKLQGRRSAKPEHSSQRKALEIEADGRDVLAEISGADVEARHPERAEQFARDEVDLAEIGRLRIAARQISVLHERSRMRIPLDAMAARQSDGKPGRLAETMPAVD